MRKTFTDEEGAEQWVDLLPLPELRIKHRDKLAEASAFGVPMNDEGEVDRAAIAKGPGGAAPFWNRYQRRRRDITVALVVTAWSWPVPVPELTPDGDLLNAESVGETSPELAEIIEPYLDKLSREPDPKAGTTSTSSAPSSGPAPARRKG